MKTKSSSAENAANENDTIDSPSHYTQGALYGIECIQAMEAQSTPDEFAGYLRLSAVKYIWRFRDKGKPLEDLRKARWFLDRLIEAVAVNEEKEVANGS